jgi:hypothetical protein
VDAELLTEEIVAELKEGIKELMEHRAEEEERKSGKERLNEFEQGLRRRLNRLGAKITQRQIEREGRVHERGRRTCTSCGEKMRNVAREGITVQSIFGPIEVRRTRYQCAQCQRNEYPLDEYYGWHRHRFTPTAKEWVCLMCQAEAYEESVELLRRVTGMEGGAHAFREVVQECGGEMLEQRGELVRQINETEAPLPQGEAPTPWMVVGADGCQILKSGERVGKRKRAQNGPQGRKRARRDKRRLRCAGQPGPVGTRERGMEVKVGLVGALVKNAHGEYEAQKKSYVSTMEKVEGFADLLFLESAQRGASNCEKVVVMGDGAPWIWNHIAPLFPRERRVDIVDWHHLKDNVEKTGEALYGAREGRPAKRWTQPQLDKLWEGNLDGVLRSLTVQQRKWEHKRGPSAEKAREAIDHLARYLEENRSRFDYPHYRRLGLPIATGEVEAACKNVVGHRMKQSGMQWRAKTAEPVLYLRAEFQSGHWDQRWQQLRRAA